MTPRLRAVRRLAADCCLSRRIQACSQESPARRRCRAPASAMASRLRSSSHCSRHICTLRYCMADSCCCCCWWWCCCCRAAGTSWSRCCTSSCTPPPPSCGTAKQRVCTASRCGEAGVKERGASARTTHLRVLVGRERVADSLRDPLDARATRSRHPFAQSERFVVPHSPPAVLRVHSLIVMETPPGRAAPLGRL